MANFYPPVNVDNIVRIPLVGPHTNRAPAAITSTGSAIAGIAVAGVAVAGSTGNSNQTKDQRFINCIVEVAKNTITEKKRFTVSKRPGMQAYNTATKLKDGHVGNAVHVWSSRGSGTDVIWAFGNTNSEIFLNSTSLGSITGKVVEITETIIGTTAYLLFSSTDSTGWYYPDGGALTKIADADFPGNNSLTTVGGFVVLDGYSFIMDTTGKIWNSDINSVTSWTSTGVIQAQMYPDTGVGLARYKNQIIAVGRDTIEFFYDAGNPSSSPLASSPQGFIKLGCINQYSFINYDDTFYWISNSDKSNITLYRLNGFSPEPVSTPAEEKILTASSLTTIRIAGGNIFGKSQLIVSCSLTVFNYDIDDNLWGEFSAGNSVNMWDRLSSTTGTTSIMYGLSLYDTQGYGYFLNNQSTQYQDNGNNFTWTIQTSKVDLDTVNRKFLSKLSLVGDAAASSTISVSWSDDDYTTFTTPRSVSMVGPNFYLSNCGQFRRRSFKLTNTDAYAIRLEAMEFQFKGGIH